jgi:hypothetical protein
MLLESDTANLAIGVSVCVAVLLCLIVYTVKMLRCKPIATAELPASPSVYEGPPPSGHVAEGIPLAPSARAR